jgi:(1->4)-alpha-D-glucan 1-alpha-D-glucosylmutase
MAEASTIAIPRATYRLQFREGFGFDAAAALAPYLARLGISHVYASPYLMARPGSTHGYDIVDHDRLNPELGDEAAFTRMVTALRDNGLGQVLDFVPNHMGVGGSDNPLWLNVLEWGPDSIYAGWFDIDWEPDRGYLANKLLVPFLGGQYGIELERGQLQLKFDPDGGTFAVWAYDTHKLPICPLHYGRILGNGHPDLERVGDAFAALSSWRPQVERRATELKAALAALAREHPDIREAVERAVARCAGSEGDFESWKPLHTLIQDQYWRLAHFRVAADDINYRRFFNINDLAGMRMELPDVFDHGHRLVFRLLEEGVLAGLRIDHIDGLLDPKGYLERLRAMAPRSDFYLVVEKILARHESLREDWPVQGTTGYEFVSLMLGLMIDPAGEASLTRAYTEFTGNSHPFAAVVRDSKLRIMGNEMASELNVLARDASRVARQNPRTADFTHNILHRALLEVIACFPVYRTYVDAESPPTDADWRDLNWAFSRARRGETSIDQSVFDFVQQLLSGDLVARPRSGFSRQAVLRCAMKLQQYSGPVMAKGLEDTAFYRYNRFVALNEVGGHPDEFGISLEAFHRANRHRAERWPNAMLGTATHDTKRGEDARARLAVLSEVPDDWMQHVQTWSRLLRARRGDVEGTAPPERNDEYLFYQLLVGTWPAELLGDSPDAAALATYTDRVKGTMVKSLREAKVHSTWTAPDLTYEQDVLSFVAEALDPARAGNFYASLLPFVGRIAELGARNTLMQTVLKLTLPGMPDIYQGCELWDLSLVDPDNRRPVDYASRMQALEELTTALAQDRSGAMQKYTADWQNGHFKLAVIATLLGYRHDHSSLFETGSYEPLMTDGANSDQVLGFLRRNDGELVLTAVARYPARLAAEGIAAESRIPLPKALHETCWRDIVSGARHRPTPCLRSRDVLALLPAAVLVAD